MKASRRAFLHLQSFEGCKLKAYLCPAGVWTIGFGHTGWAELETGERVQVGLQVTKDTVLKSIAEAEALLIGDIEFFEQGLERLLDTSTLNRNQYDGLLSFTFNVGLLKLAGSTLLKKLKKADFKAAADEFLKWNKARNPKTKKLEPLKGLTTRREAERALFTR